MKRLSRGFKFAAFSLLLVASALALVGFLGRTRTPPRPAPCPDVWIRTTPGAEPSIVPDGPPMRDWVQVGSGDALPATPGRMTFIVLVPSGRELPSTFELLKARVTGEPSWVEDTHFLYRTEDVVTTPSGKWQRYSENWWKRPGPTATATATAPAPAPPPAPAPATK